MESCNGGVGINEGLCKLLVGSDEFLHSVIFSGWQHWPGCHVTWPSWRLVRHQLQHDWQKRCCLQSYG